MKEILHIEGLVKRYAGQNEGRKILDGLDLSVSENEFLCILGPSGCGKSTLLRCIAGFESFEGSIICGGEPVRKPSIDRIMVFQDYNQLFPWKTVEKNIQYPLKVGGLRDRERLCEISDETLRKVGLEGYQKYYPHELSGGMKQRAAIAKALALKPKLILMDEPFAALDAITRNRLQRELQQIYESEKMTVIFVTHNIQEALTLGTRLILIGRDGRIVIDETNRLTKPVTPSTEGYGAMWDHFSDALAAENTQEALDREKEAGHGESSRENF